MELTMHRSNQLHHFWDAFDPITSALSTFRGTTLIFPSDPIAAEAHTAFRRYRMVAAPNLIQHHGRSLAAKVTTLSAYDHGQNAAKRGKHLQTCPFDTGTMEWRQWREGFLSITRLTDPKAVSNPVEYAAFCNPFCLIGGLQ
jgi:hypothetical protein